MMVRLVGAVLVVVALSPPAFAVVTPEASVPILLYHRLGPTVADGMTIKTSVLQNI